MLTRSETLVTPAFVPPGTLTLKGCLLKGAPFLSLSPFPKCFFFFFFKHTYIGSLRINLPHLSRGSATAFLTFAKAPGEPMFWRNLRKEDPPGINGGCGETFNSNFHQLRSSIILQKMLPRIGNAILACKISLPSLMPALASVCWERNTVQRPPSGTERIRVGAGLLSRGGQRGGCAWGMRGEGG